MKTLLAFAGPRDPFARGLIGEEEQPGPILSTVLTRPFSNVVVFHTDETRSNAEATARAVRNRSAETRVRLVRIACADTSDYEILLGHLRNACRKIVAATPGTEFFIAASPEPAAVHACWVLLVSSGDLDAHLLQVRPPGYSTDTTARVSETSVPPTSPSAMLSMRRRPILPAPAESGPPPTMRDAIFCFEEAAAAHDEPEEPAYGPPAAAAPEPASDLADAMAEVGLVAEAPAMRQVLEQVAALAKHEVSILVLGETGTGKELIARLIRGLSARARQPLVVVNCGGLSTTLVESTLFGHSRGAFTGAVADQTGKFEEANNGTLFLDEIGNMPIEVQPKLLRVLEDGIVEPLGGRKPVNVNVRVVAATNAEIEKAIAKGQFRQDLYYRLAGGIVRIPPLRKRREDIPRIAVHVLEKLNRSSSRPRRFSTDALTRLQAHDWPGNIRELQNVIGQSMMLCRREILDADDLLIDPPAHGPDPLTHLPEPHDGFWMEGFLQSARKQLMLRALELSAGNQSGAARLLGISPQAVHKFLREG